MGYAERRVPLHGENNLLELCIAHEIITGIHFKGRYYEQRKSLLRRFAAGRYPRSYGRPLCSQVHVISSAM